ncbi:MAG: B12-binding domain-containing radical SAM protein [Firmicutes bacterium]|nr:B12-binding domain-containing radical SAM protein [Bacillota bacterium]
MRVVLAKPFHPRVRPEDEEESLGVGYLAAVARKAGHDAVVVDATPPRWPPQRLAAEVVRLRPEVVGISLLFQELIPEAMALVAFLRKAGFTGHVVVGGHPPTFLWRELCRDWAGFDSLVVGEGEATFVELLEALAAGRDWTGLPGVVAAGPTGPGPEGPAPRPLVSDLDELPFPARDALPAYLDRRKGARVAPVLRSRGCYGNCSFCDTRAFYASSPGPAWRVRSAGNVADEIEALVRDHAVEAVRFWDDNFIGPGRRGREAAEELARELLRRRRGVRFSFECRVTDVDPDLFRLLKEAGLHRVFLGVEAMTQRQLDFYGKQVTVEDNRRALRVLESLGVDVTIGMIPFDPDVTVNELETNLAFLRESFGSWGAARNKVAQPWNRLEVYAGTPLEAALRRQGRLKGDYVRYDYDFADPTVARIYAAGSALRRVGLPIRDFMSRLRGAR